MTTRRQILGATAALGGLSLAGLPRRAFAAETLTGVSYLPPSYADLAYGSQGLVDRVNKAGEGVVALDYYDSGRLVAADEQLPALRAGTIDFMFHTSSYVTRSLPILGVLGLPGVVGPLYENPDRLRRGAPLFELIAAELEKQG
ncbi:MAG TPA: C4-dicarboxylate ABC transporter substrate-binding protein, partial [Paracoccus sp.]|nr:C4-dicarboxylate ABC transporter substrate-binding protein [Paracoccus sp. (in: a-proteobacteria)]